MLISWSWEANQTDESLCFSSLQWSRTISEIGSTFWPIKFLRVQVYRMCLVIIFFPISNSSEWKQLYFSLWGRWTGLGNYVDQRIRKIARSSLKLIWENSLVHFCRLQLISVDVSHKTSSFFMSVNAHFYAHNTCPRFARFIPGFLWSTVSLITQSRSLSQREFDWTSIFLPFNTQYQIFLFT